MTTVLKATGPEHFLAALPRLTGMHELESLYLVIFEGKQAQGAARIDLPPMPFTPTTHDATMSWLDTISTLMQQAGDVALVIYTSDEIGKRPTESEHGSLLNALTFLAGTFNVNVRVAAVIAPDGWATFDDESVDSPRRDLTEISTSELYDPDVVTHDAETWRRNHPGQTVDNPQALHEQMAKARRKQF